MGVLFSTFEDLAAAREPISRARYGMIEASQGTFRCVVLRPWPKLVSGIEALWLGGWSHGHESRDRVRLWYSQPLAHSKYLVLSYAVSGLKTTTLTMRAALQALDQIAEIKRSDAILCQAFNSRLSDRVMRFGGFERHLPGKRQRHFIRRFYGEYAPRRIDSATSSHLAIRVVEERLKARSQLGIEP